jgi:hypothetical protein
MAAPGEEGAIIAFPHARVRPGGRPALDLGFSALARQLGMDPTRLSGHWCSRCRGIWQGLLLEVECPRCGSRKG